MTSYRLSQLFSVMVIALSGGLSTELSAAKDPDKGLNVLFLFTDDQPHHTIRALGNPHIHTPNLDRLVARGLTFTNAYIMGGSSPAVCSPSRAAMLTGRTLWNLENQGLWKFEMSAERKTLPERWRQQGYETFATGKNEPGREAAFARSFSTGDKILFRGMTRSQYRLPLHAFSPEGKYPRENEVLHTGTHSSVIYADAAIRFLKGRAETAPDERKPYFAYVAFQTPHDPWEFDESYGEWYDTKKIPLPESFAPEHPFDNGMLRIRDEMLAGFPRTPEKVRELIAAHYATISQTDAEIGRILKALEASGEADHTLIVFTSDNGMAVGRHGLIGKQNVYDHSVHVPMILAGPGIPKGETREQLCYNYDIHPTLYQRAGMEIPGEVEYKSLNRVIDDPEVPHREHLYFAFMNWQRAMYDGRYKLIEYAVDGKRHTQLFDLAEDPEETQNLANEPGHEATLAKLRKLLERERVRLNDGNTDFPFTNQQGKEFWKTYHSDEG